MSKIHSKDTSIELQLRKALWHKGYRYRKNYKALPGSPDIVLTKYKIAIFCDSEFFHGKDWEYLKLRLEKGHNPDYWIKKIERNRNRDWENDKKLLFLGYTVIHFWGQDIKKHTDADCHPKRPPVPYYPASVSHIIRPAINHYSTVLLT